MSDHDHGSPTHKHVNSRLVKMEVDSPLTKGLEFWLSKWEMSGSYDQQLRRLIII